MNPYAGSLQIEHVSNGVDGFGLCPLGSDVVWMGDDSLSAGFVETELVLTTDGSMESKDGVGCVFFFNRSFSCFYACYRAYVNYEKNILLLKNRLSRLHALCNHLHCIL